MFWKIVALFSLFWGGSLDIFLSSALHQNNWEKCQSRVESADQSSSQGMEAFHSYIDFFYPTTSINTYSMSLFSSPPCVNASNLLCTTGKRQILYWRGSPCLSSRMLWLDTFSLSGIVLQKMMPLEQYFWIWTKCPPLVARLKVMLFILSFLFFVFTDIWLIC